MLFYIPVHKLLIDLTAFLINMDLFSYYSNKVLDGNTTFWCTFLHFITQIGKRHDVLICLVKSGDLTFKDSCNLI